MAVTLQAIRQALGYSLDDLQYHAATSGTSSTVVIAELISNASNASTARYDGRWLYNVTKGTQRRVRTNGYAPSTGTLTFDPTATSASAADRIELTGLFPGTVPPFSADANYNAIINTAAGKILFPSWVSPTISPGTHNRTLFSYLWLDRPERLGWPFPQPDGSPHPLLMEPAPFGDGWVSADWRRPTLRFDVGTLTLELGVPYTAGSSGSLRLNVMRPVNTWVAVGGTFADSSVGMVNESDQLQIAMADILDVARWEAIKILADRSVSSASGRWADRLEEAERAARRVRWFDDTQDKPRPPAAAAGQVA